MGEQPPDPNQAAQYLPQLDGTVDSPEPPAADLQPGYQSNGTITTPNTYQSIEPAPDYTHFHQQQQQQQRPVVHQSTPLNGLSPYSLSSNHQNGASLQASVSKPDLSEPSQ